MNKKKDIWFDKKGKGHISKELKERFLNPDGILINPTPINYKPPRLNRPKCRWCGGSTRALSNNGIIGPGYREGNYVCNDCGKVQ